MPQPALAPPDPRTEELRLALVLNGGVSLAVWMSGVTFELNRLVRESHPVYQGLLRLTATAARIDVVSGTSAGGINGAALALAQIHDTSLLPLRDVWLGAAGLDQLLRDPDDAEPTSLLMGDDWFLPQLQRAFGELGAGARLPTATVPMLLSLTSTLLDGVVQKRIDDFGAIVEDRVHRASWRFERLDERDDFARPLIASQLALAARSTASFPVAFEPVHYDPRSPLFADGVPLQIRGERPGTTPHFLLDGGILDNQPFEAALDGIARLPATGNTRRVLAYIVPDPAATAEARGTAPDGSLERPTLAEVAWRSLVSIPATQSIASHMEMLRASNDRATSRWRRLVGAVRHVGTAGLTGAAARFLPAYRARRVDGVVDYLLNRAEAGFAKQQADEGRMRRATRQWLRSTWSRTAETQPRLWETRVPTAYRADAAVLSAGTPWHWGLYPIEFMAEFTIEVLRRTQRLRGVTVGRTVEPDGTVVGPATAPAPAGGHVPWEYRDRSPGALRAGPRIGDQELQPLWSRAYQCWNKTRAMRGREDVLLEQRGGAGFADLVDAWRATGGAQPPEDKALQLLTDLLASQREDVLTNGDDARAVCQVLADLQPPIDAALRDTRARLPERTDVAEALSDLEALRAFLYEPAANDATMDRLDRIAARLLALEVFEVTASSRLSGRNVQAELVQISARIASAWGGSDNPADKLTGMKLAHFAAFYKRSWRANDWTFGRLDGIDRAVRIALNPDALQRRFGQSRVTAPDGSSKTASRYVFDYLHALAVTGAEADFVPMLRARWDADRPAIAAELAWLDLPSTVPPPVLHRSAAALSRRLQLEALRFELPELAKSLLTENEGGAPPSRIAGARMLALLAPRGVVGVPSPEDAEALVRGNLLGSDHLEDQPGSDYFTRLASQGLATTHSALSSRHSGLDPIGMLFRVTALPVRILYWLANRLPASSTGAAVEGAVLAVGVVLVAGGLLTDTVPRQAVTMGWAMVAGVLAATLLRRLLWGSLLVVALAIGVAVLVPSALGTVLAAAAIVVLLVQPWSPVVSATTLVLLAAWWSAGGSVPAAWAFWNRVVYKTPVSSETLVLVDRLEQAVVPALILIAVVSLNAVSRWSAHRAPRRVLHTIERASASIRHRVAGWRRP